jgi:hypothetical protein
MTLQRATVVNAGMYTNPNTFTRSLASSYENMANQINVLSEIFTFGERSPVADGIDGRWEWSTAINGASTNGTANPVSMGLDGTSIFTYAGSDYGSLSYLFKITNDLDEDRPSTVYETFINYKNYVDAAIAERTNALTTIVANTTTDLSGVENGTLLVCQDEQISISNWSIVDDNLTGAGVINIVPDNALYANDQYIVIEPTAPDHIHIRPGGTIDDSTAKLILGGELTNVTVSDDEGQHVKIYSRNEDNDGSHVWAFSEDGYMSVPANKDLLDAVDGSSLTGGGNRVAIYDSNEATSYIMNGTANIILTMSGQDQISITLPDSSETYIKVGYEITIADMVGQAATSNNVAIYPNESDSILGAPGGIIIDTDYGLVNLKYVGGNHWLLMYGR